MADSSTKKTGCIGCLVLIVVIVIIFGVIGEVTRPDDTSDQNNLGCLMDFDCLANNREWIRSAERACAEAVERQAPWDYEWTNSWPSSKFHTVAAGGAQSFRMIGDRVRFQNGFGAWRHMEYTCWYQPLRDRVETIKVY